MKTLEELQALFRGDAFATQAGILIEQSDQEGVVCSVRLTPSHRNAVGRVQGGLIFTLADFAFAVLVNREALGTVTLNSSIQFLAAPRGGVLKAVARPIKEGRAIVHCSIEVTDDLGTRVAQVLSTGFKS